MYLSSLSIMNVRQFEERTFEFSPGFNLLVGENGAGKTTIFKAMLAVLGDTVNIQSSLKVRDEDIRLRTEQAVIEANVGLADARTKKFRYKKPLWGRVSRSPRGATRPLILSYASNEAVSRSMKVKQVKQFGRDVSDKIRREQEFLYFASEEELTNDRLDQRGKRFGNSQQVRAFIGEVISTFSTEFEDFHWRFEPYDCSLIQPKNVKSEMPIDAKQQERLEKAAMRFFREGLQRRRNNFAIWPDQSEVVLSRESQSSMDRIMETLLYEVWGDMDISRDIRNVLSHSQLKVNLTPSIMIKRSVGQLTLSQLSDGEQRLFSLFVDIARELSLQEDYDGSIGSGKAIVLIDEIDVHLHPKWQRKIVPALEDLFPNCQFIATTHSPFIIQSMQDGKLISLDGKIEAEYANQNIEDVAEDILRVEIPQRSKRYVEMMKIASQYYRTLSEAEQDSNVDVSELKMKLDAISVRYSNDPFFAANLDFQWETFLAKKDISES